MAKGTRAMLHTLRTVIANLRRLAERCDGNVAIMFGLIAVAAFIAAGMAIDVGRARAVKIRLGASLDAAALAVGSTDASAFTTDQLQQRLENFFTANYPSSVLGTPTTPAMTFSNNNNVINVTASATVPTSLMAIVGVNSITVSASSQVTRQSLGLEVALVLDNTGSMLNNSGSAGINNMQAMIADADQFVNILFGANTSNNLLKISVVPFVTAVNVGDLAPSIIQAGSLPTYNGTTINYSQTNPGQWKGCLEEPNAPADQSESTAAGSWTPYWWPSDSSWNPWSLNPTHAAIQNPPVAWTCNGVANSYSPNLSCGTPIQRLTSDKATVLSAVNAMQAWCRSGTMIHTGMVWGWRTISPLSVFQTNGTPDALPYNTTGWQKAVILETDGTDNFNKCPNSNTDTNNGCPTSTPPSSDYSAYGFLSDNRLGTTSQSTAHTVLDNRLASICTAMKAAGITIYTIAFSGGAVGSQTMMQNCATDPGKYFYAPD
jgi:Flp pilus assembly protein TadG